jgi:hemoglobin
MKKTNIFVTACFTLLTVISCKKETKTETVYVDNTPAPPPATLYSRLGGITPISLVVDKFISNCATNNFIKGRFAATASDPYRLQFFRYNLIDQICAGSGGPCTYKGKDMKTAHTGMNVSAPEFDTLVVQLINAMNTYSVPSKEQNELLGVLGPMKPDIINK